MARGQTPSQTVGPFFAYGLVPAQYGYPLPPVFGHVLCDERTPGEHIRFEGRVLDGEDQPIDDALIELWQADAGGRFRHPDDRADSDDGFIGFGRCGTGTDPQARFRFRTVKPAALSGEAAPHLVLVVFMRGLLVHLYTRVYFDDETEANARDVVLASVPAGRRPTLVARRRETPDGTVYHLDIHMQGPHETVFFDV